MTSAIEIIGIFVLYLEEEGMGQTGIITTCNAVNYGAVLQAYALKTALEDLGSRVKIINYCGDEYVAGRKLYRKVSGVKSLLYNILICFSFRYRKHRETVIEYFDRFKRERLEIEGAVIRRKEDILPDDGYSAMICGSDQVWNLNLFDDDVYFLCFGQKFPAVPCFAYGVSIAERMTEAQEALLKERTKHFEAISVRERDTAKWLGDLLKRSVVNVVDPVFLPRRERWESLAEGEEGGGQRYMFVYFISHAREDRQIVETLQSRTGLKMRVLNLHPVDYIKGAETSYGVKPEEFVRLIKDAEIIVTDSFHATAFSIIFNKEFYNIRRSSRNIRIENLYNIFDMERRYVKLDELGGHWQRTGIDYTEINQRLVLLKGDSMRYLKRIAEVDNG